MRPTKSILITGCSSGIGYDAAHGLAGARLAGVRDLPQAGRIARGCGAKGWRASGSTTPMPTAWRTALAEALARTGGRLDALFNNGAFACPGAVEDLPTEALRAIFETNLFG